METEIKALVVDDSAVIRKIIVKALATAGVEDVDQATDGAQALEAVSLKDYGLFWMPVVIVVSPPRRWTWITKPSTADGDRRLSPTFGERSITLPLARDLAVY